MSLRSKLHRILAMLGSEMHLSVPDSRHQGSHSLNPNSSPNLSPNASGEAKATTQRLSAPMKDALIALRRQPSAGEEQGLMAEIQRLVLEAWGLTGLGREVACALCDLIRLEGGLDRLLELLRSPASEIRYQAARLLEQILVAENRDRVARLGLGVILELAREREDVPMARVVSGILQHMFKHSEETSYLLIANGGLDAILYWCRATDPALLRHCAVALANCATHSGHRNQRLMIEKKAADWLFPLAFCSDQLVRFHACLAVAVLATNREIEGEVEKSGSLDLVEPFIASLSPGEFARVWLDSGENSQGRTAEDLQRLVLLLDSPRLEAQCIAAFYLCVEAGIKCQQRKTQIFHEIGAVQSLKRIVSYSRNTTTSALAKRSLKTMGEAIPRKLSPAVPNWKPCEVQTWLQQIGLSNYCKRFLELEVDGDLLLVISDSDLMEDVGIKSSITRKRFLRELTELKTYANYSTCDPSNVADWLGGIDPHFRQYTYHLVRTGMDRASLPSVTETQLLADCGVHLAFHRAKILLAAKELLLPCVPDSPSNSSSEGPDVFISYRRTTGSQLASLLKVHLQLRGFNVFIDVEKLEAGKFEDKLIQSVKRAKNFVLVLSSNALDKCMGDTEMKDWVHKEIAMALNSGKNIVPVTDQFAWPDSSSLPEDMRGILKFNGIMWCHEYQDATIEKILRFLCDPPRRNSTVTTDGSEKAVSPPRHASTP